MQIEEAHSSLCITISHYKPTYQSFTLFYHLSGRQFGSTLQALLSSNQQKEKVKWISGHLIHNRKQSSPDNTKFYCNTNFILQ